MRISKHIKNLYEYIVNDKIYQDYKNGIEPSHNDGNADFEYFCIGHCEDIEWALNKLKETQSRDLKSFKENTQIKIEMVGLISEIDRIIFLLNEKDIKSATKSLKEIRQNLDNKTE